MARVIPYATLSALRAPAAAAQTAKTIGPDVQWSLAGVGDVITNRCVAPFEQPDDPGFHDSANVVRAADAAFTNLEQSIYRMSDFDGWRAAERGGNKTLATPFRG